MKKENFYLKALFNLYELTGSYNGKVIRKVIENELIEISEIEKKEIEVEAQKLLDEYNNNEYQRLRVLEYPTIGDQLDMIFHDKINNTNIFETTILNIKNKYPKP